MTSLRQAIDALQPAQGGWRGPVPDNWLQGRTAYGGFSTALALVAAQRILPDLPPLRSAQVTFVGPLAGEVVASARVLRQGRNATFVEAAVDGDTAAGLRATFVFMREVESSIDHVTGRAPDFPVPGPDTPTFNGHSAVAFSRNFELLDRHEGTAATEWLRWARLIDRTGLDPAVELVCLADCLPPAALKLIGKPAPLSSVTWLLNLLTPAPATRDGWWLLRAATDHVRGGSSSQAMAIWNAEGAPVAQQLQSVVVYA